MALDSYSALKTEVQGYLEDTDLATEVDTFLALFEAYVKRELRIRSMMKRCQAVLSTTTRYLALPAGFRLMHTLRLLTDPVTVMKFVSIDEMNRHIQSATGKPELFTVHEEIEFDRISDSAYNAEMLYYADFTGLSDANTSNALLVEAPDLYLFGTLLEAAPYLDNDERIPTWESKFARSLESVQTSDRKSRHVGPLIAKTRGDRP